MDLAQIGDIATEAGRALARLAGAVWNQRGEVATTDLTKARAAPARHERVAAEGRRTE